MQTKHMTKIQHPFTIKTFSKQGREWDVLSLIKNIYKKASPTIILNGEKLKSFPQKSGTDRDVPSYQDRKSVV